MNINFSSKTMLFLGFVFCYMSIAFTFSVLGFETLQSDAQGYWDDSMKMDAPFHPFHVPGYPFVIFIFRTLTGSYFSPSFYLQLISFLSFSLVLFLIFELGKLYSNSNEIGWVSAVLFMLWPMVGLTYVIYPVADSLAMCLYLLGIYLLLKQRETLGAFAWAGALFVHKAMWIFVAISFLLWFFQARQTGIKRVLIHGLVVFGPLLFYALLGAVYHQSLIWIISSNLRVEVSSTSNLLILDGVVGTFRAGNLQSWVKGGILLSQLLVAGYVVFHALRRRSWGWEFGLAIGLATLILLCVLNRYEIWASVRFGRLLVIPVASILSERFFVNFHKAGVLKKAFIAILAMGLYVSQHFYAWYMTTYFEG
jgi:hypothetical protein